MSYRLQYRVRSETYSALCNLQCVHKGNIDIMGSWFSHITRPLNGLGFMKGIAELHIRKNSYWIGFYLSSYPGTWFSPYRTLSFSYKPLTKWVGKYERKSPVMGSTSSSHNSADSIDVPQDQKKHLQGFSQVNRVSIFLQFTFFHYAWCSSLSSIEHISHITVVIIDYSVFSCTFF